MRMLWPLHGSHMQCFEGNMFATQVVNHLTPTKFAIEFGTLSMFNELAQLS
jgi:hypothetical protein